MMKTCSHIRRRRRPRPPRWASMTGGSSVFRVFGCAGLRQSGLLGTPNSALRGRQCERPSPPTASCAGSRPLPLGNTPITHHVAASLAFHSGKRLHPAPRLRGAVSVPTRRIPGIQSIWLVPTSRSMRSSKTARLVHRR